MFSPKTPIASPRPSPFHTRSSARQTRRNLKNQSSLSVQSFHGPQMLDETLLHKIEAYGLPLPVLITEALTLSDRSTTEITACIDPSGWAWLVGGRKLFVWRYVASNNSKNVNCKELTLPPSDLAHSAERVCVIPNENQSAACVAVSPEGVVRYWPNIAFESNIAEISAELRGEECARVINFYPHGCLLATTTSSLLLLEPAVGQASIQCKPLKASQGLFSGISRRMSSFIFGSSQVQTNGIPLQTILAAPYNDDEENIEEKRSFYVLSGTSICKWQVPSLGTEKLLYQLDAERMFREALSKKIWGQDAVHLTQLKTWLIDLQLTRDGIVMLSAGVNLEADQKIYYALAFFDTSDDAQSVNISNLIVLDYTQKYSEELDEQISAYKLLFLSTEKANTAYVYNNSTILMLSGNSSLDKMDLKTTGDVLLGAGIAKGVAVFFSNAYGFFSVSPTKSDSSILDDSTNLNMSARAELSTFMLNSSKANDLIECSDNKSKLKGTFIASLAAEQNQDQTEEAVSEILTSTNPKSGSQTSELDTIVAGISQDLIDDYPNADPRWAESEKHDSTGSTASVILIQQLKDKQKAHDLFVSFLKNCGLWNKINLIGIRGSVMPTRLLLCEHVEKLEAAIALRELHSDWYSWCHGQTEQNNPLFLFWLVVTYFPPPSDRIWAVDECLDLKCPSNELL
ncbi:hypothetical protein Btru_003224 [Bulinus truncatus]|nr:hypothetical protein Btru_003224 [Bulinus truncatus]